MRTLSLKNYPQKIEPDKLEGLLEEVRKGNKTAIKQVILGHVRLTISIVNRYIEACDCFFLGDELDSAAMEGLVVAVNNVANGRMTNHNNISGYITSFVHSYLFNCLRDSKIIHFPRGHKSKTILPLAEDLMKGEENDLRELREELQFITQTANELAIVKLRSAGYVDSEIGQKLGLSKLNVQRIRAKLRTRFQERERKDEYRI